MRMSPTGPSETIHPAHIWFLLDRSGSMQALLEEVVLGLQEFVREQRLADPRARLTLVQFDSEDPHELILDAERLAVVDEGRATKRFDPRAATPLYDAIASLIERADRYIGDGGDDADQLFVIFTDGLENASTACTRARAFRMIKERRSRGWTFAFLGANQDAFAAGDAIGVAYGNTKNWEASRAGTRAMLADLSQKSAVQLKRTRPQRRQKHDDFFGDDES
jgi:Mg-chelatase subunit ChlD